MLFFIHFTLIFNCEAWWRIFMRCLCIDAFCLHAQMFSLMAGLRATALNWTCSTRVFFSEGGLDMESKCVKGKTRIKTSFCLDDVNSWPMKGLALLVPRAKARFWWISAKYSCSYISRTKTASKLCASSQSQRPNVSSLDLNSLVISVKWEPRPECWLILCTPNYVQIC